MSDLKGEIILDIDGEEIIVKANEFGWEDGGDERVIDGDHFTTPEIHLASIITDAGDDIELTMYVHSDGSIDEPFISSYNGDQNVEIRSVDLSVDVVGADWDDEPDWDELREEEE
ncbi:hypothetical protein [Aeromonas caviae]|uniref:Uncharacterized protein n=1 Tax=Aeromonas caviae TaxID=648 RepID=A0AAJ5Z9G0_AERCA|nr:hypothetical protein [Aeromonas caviae]WFF99537.1 hypothetical protein P5S46_08180 [Aeromonas caviae]